jgi:hypothetical protein
VRTFDRVPANAFQCREITVTSARFVRFGYLTGFALIWSLYYAYNRIVFKTTVCVLLAQQVCPRLDSLPDEQEPGSHLHIGISLLHQVAMLDLWLISESIWILRNKQNK